jgi:flagellar biogenesis protein FliO
MSDFIQLSGYVLIFGSILYLAYIATRFIGKKTAASMQSKHIELVEQVSLGLDKRLLLIRVGTEYFLFVSGKKEFRKVAKVNIDNAETENQGDKAADPGRRKTDQASVAVDEDGKTTQAEVNEAEHMPIEQKANVYTQFDFRQIFDKYINIQRQKKKANKSRKDSDPKPHRTEIIQQNVRKLKQLTAEQRFDKEE